MAKAVKISDEAYKKLIKMREKLLKKDLVLEKPENRNFYLAIKAMGIGAFAGWLILEKIGELEK